MAVILPPNSSGSTVDTKTLASKERQVVAIGDAVAATNLAVVDVNGALVTRRPLDWSAFSVPAAATAASASRAAAAAGIKHVCTSISATVSTVGTAQTAALVLNLRDGATGAGTIIWSKQISLPVNTTWEFNLGGLNIVGSNATAMTLEFAANNVAASFSSCAITGYDV